MWGVLGISEVLEEWDDSGRGRCLDSEFQSPELCAEESYHEIPLEEFNGSRAKFRASFWHLTAVSERSCLLLCILTPEISAL